MQDDTNQGTTRYAYYKIALALLENSSPNLEQVSLIDRIMKAADAPKSNSNQNSAVAEDDTLNSFKQQAATHYIRQDTSTLSTEEVIQNVETLFNVADNQNIRNAAEQTALKNQQAFMQNLAEMSMENEDARAYVGSFTEKQREDAAFQYAHTELKKRIGSKNTKVELSSTSNDMTSMAIAQMYGNFVDSSMAMPTSMASTNQMYKSMEMNTDNAFGKVDNHTQDGSIESFMMPPTSFAESIKSFMGVPPPNNMMEMGQPTINENIVRYSKDQTVSNHMGITTVYANSNVNGQTPYEVSFATLPLLEQDHFQT